MLNNLDALGKAERLAGTEAGGAVVVPAIKARDFNFTRCRTPCSPATPRDARRARDACRGPSFVAHRRAPRLPEARGS